MRKILDFIIKYSVYILVFLMPLFWLPWSIEVFEFSKQYLLIFLVSLAFLAWLAKMVVVQKRFIFRRTPLDLWILLFMFITILSASFSIDKISSWLGYYGRFSDSVIGLISVALLYFVITNNIKEKNEKKNVSSGEGLIPKEKSSKEESTKDKSNGVLSPKNIFIFFLSSSALVLIISLLSVFGVWTKIPNLPQVMSFKSFNPINSSLEGLSIFLVALIGFVVGMFLQQIKIIKSKKSNGCSIIPPDLFMCDDCLKELKSQKDRRNNYYFITCTNCGPRFSIINDLPYDRINTSMDEFEMCEDCKTEYTDPLNRRYHAQTIACKKCGPKLQLFSGTKKVKTKSDIDSIKKTVELIKKTEIVGIKGVGGIHLCCLTKEKVVTDYVMVDGLGVGDVSNIVLRDRRMMAEDGMIVIIATIDSKTGNSIGNPDIISRGFVDMKENRELIEKTRMKVKKLVNTHDTNTPADDDYIKNKVRNDIGQFLFSQTKRRPMVLPVVIKV